MAKLTHDKLMTLEAYAKARNTFRAEVMAHKKHRQVHLGDHVTLLFEDELTMQYQVQEMLRLERIFEPEQIQDELDVYNPLIPDGSNWKATMMIEYPDAAERQRKLATLTGIEDRVWVQAAGHERVYAIADEDLDRTTDEKTSAVHFMRFELTPQMVTALKQGAVLSMGVDHPAYQASLNPVPAEIRVSLLHDLQS
jgi:glycerol-3-phosphate dehydrogenase subunit C